MTIKPIPVVFLVIPIISCHFWLCLKSCVNNAFIWRASLSFGLMVRALLKYSMAHSDPQDYAYVNQGEEGPVPGYIEHIRLLGQVSGPY